MPGAASSEQSSTCQRRSVGTRVPAGSLALRHDAAKITTPSAMAVIQNCGVTTANSISASEMPNNIPTRRGTHLSSKSLFTPTAGAPHPYFRQRERGAAGQGTSVASHLDLTGRPLLERLPCESDEALARRLYAAPFVALAHGVEPDPLFNYAKLAAQRLFELMWDEFIGLPSRLSAEAPERSDRSRLLARVATHSFIDDYSGVRISKSGQRFRIQRATVWNVSDAAGRRVGQAACFSDWAPCDESLNRPAGHIR